MATLRSTVIAFDPVLAVWETPPTWKLTVTVFVIVEPDVVPTASAGEAPNTASARQLPVASSLIFLVIFGLSSL
jgi:hypothetical protein